MGISRAATACLAALLFIATAPVSDEIRLRPAWQALDANRDGKVTLDEVNPILAKSLAKSDLDGDGAITLAEYVMFDRDPTGGSRLPLAANVRLISDIPYAGTHDPRQRVDIYLPKTPSVAGPLPVIADIHGGGWGVGSKIMTRPEVMELVNSGRYAAVSIGYRLAWQDTWPAQLDDVKAAVRWIRGNARTYGFDRTRICAMGGSAGGHLAAMLGVTGGERAQEGTLGAYRKQSSRVQCVIDMFGPADLPRMALRPIVEGLVGGPLSEKADVARSASPITQVDAKDPPFFIVHGTKDPLVEYAQSVAFAAALREAGVPVLFQTVEGGGHGDFGAATPEVARRVRAFLDRTFYDGTTPVPTDTLRK